MFLGHWIVTDNKVGLKVCHAPSHASFTSDFEFFFYLGKEIHNTIYDNRFSEPKVPQFKFHRRHTVLKPLVLFLLLYHLLLLFSLMLSISRS